jgi:hypothetical protein
MPVDDLRRASGAISLQAQLSPTDRAGRKGMARRYVISERALISRVKRKLAHANEILTVARPGSRLEAQLGRFIICDGHNGNPRSWGGSEALVEWARDLGVLHSDEALT